MIYHLYFVVLLLIEPYSLSSSKSISLNVKLQVKVSFPSGSSGVTSAAEAKGAVLFIAYHLVSLFSPLDTSGPSSFPSLGIIEQVILSPFQVKEWPNMAVHSQRSGVVTIPGSQ